MATEESGCCARLVFAVRALSEEAGMKLECADSRVQDTDLVGPSNYSSGQ